MSALSHGLRRRHDWNRVCQFVEQKRRAESPDWFFYLAAVILMYVYRTELLGLAEKYFNGLF